MIGMSSQAFGGILNPKVKKGNTTKFGVPGIGVPSGEKPMQPLSQPKGSTASFPPISPSRNMLNRQMALPGSSNASTVNKKQPVQNKMRTGAVRRGIF